MWVCRHCTNEAIIIIIIIIAWLFAFGRVVCLLIVSWSRFSAVTVDSRFCTFVKHSLRYIRSAGLEHRVETCL